MDESGYEGGVDGRNEGPVLMRASPPVMAPQSEPRTLTAEQWRVRALAAEERVSKLEKELAQCQKLLTEAREAIDAAERRNEIERELVRQGAIDLETTVMLSEAAVAAMPKADVQAAVADLRRRKPFLFRTPRGSAMASVGSTAGADESLGLAAQARVSGDRASLMRYLRSKRK